MNRFPHVVVLFSVCVHEIFLCPHFREEKSHRIFFFFKYASCILFPEGKQDSRQAVRFSQAVAKNQATAVAVGCSSWWDDAPALAGTASAWHHQPCQGLGKYRHAKRCLQLCKHHVRIFPNHDSQRTHHSYGRAGRLATADLGIRF